MRTVFTGGMFLLPMVCAWSASTGAAEDRGDAAASVVELSPHVAVHLGAGNIGIIRDGARALLIDCGDVRVAASLATLGVTAVEEIVFTHHHRDQACGAGAFVAQGARVGVPAAERALFDDVASYWNTPRSRWHIYTFRPYHLVRAEPLAVDRVFTPGDVFTWGPATVRVLATPGHTDGSVTYLAAVDGFTIAFTGDAIYDAGMVWDLHSLQKGTQTSDYHGFMGAVPALVAGLAGVKDAAPDLLVPSHGNIMRDPAAAIDALAARLSECYDRYVAIAALRYYFPALFEAYAGRQDHMAFGATAKPPDCLRHVGTSWILVSKTGAAFVMDAGSPRVVETLLKWRDAGEITAVEGLWVTHYHDDHVDAIPRFQEVFDCPCITDRHVAQVISDPLAWRLPCISPHAARVDRVTHDGESWTWREFTLTAYPFPGQTLYHAGLLVEGEGLRMFFTGDSFTPAGIDDYCALNRNWLGAGVGFDRCVALLEKLVPTHIFNCHVNVAFTFTPEQYRFMRANLAARVGQWGALVPWEHPNFALDPSWVRCTPYEQRALPGANVSVTVHITNHATREVAVRCRPVLPAAWDGAPAAWGQVQVAASREGAVPLTVRIPATAVPGRYVLPVDVIFGGRELPQHTEAIIVVGPQGGG